MPELASLPNPFQDNVVHDAWQSPADVADINRHVFDACLAGLASAQRGQPDSLRICGSAGSGKTHLLTRFQRHLQDTARDAQDQVLHCVFVFVRLQTSPQMLWQHVRRRLAHDLMRKSEGITQLQRLVAHQIAERSHSSPRAEVRRLRVLGKENHEVVSDHLAHLAKQLDLPRDLCVVLEHLLCNRGVTDAAAWLKGDSLPERVLADLGLGLDEHEDREQAAREIVLALALLAGGSLPIVFCFDQVEALQRSHDDLDAFFRFGRMAADLHDSDPNVFIITCLQSALLTTFDQAVREADKNRFMRREVVIKDLSPDQVAAVIRARLQSHPELAELRAQHAENTFYPFDEPFVTSLTKQSPCVPRRVLARARRAFEEIQHGGAPTKAEPHEFLSAAWREREQRVAASQDPARTTATLLQSAEVLETLADAQVNDGHSLGADLVLGSAKRVAISIRNEADGRSLTPKLRALLGRVQATKDLSWVLVRDPRLPVSKSAVRAREYLDQLSGAGVRLVEPTAAALRALQALSSILADAKSGDLANEGDTVEKNQVLKWLRSLRDDLSIEPVRELIEDLLHGQTQSDAALEQDLAVLLASKRILDVDVAARELSRSNSELIELALRVGSRFLLLNGPPAVLVDVSGVNAEIGVAV